MRLLELTIGPRHFSLPIDVDRVELTQRLEQAAAADGAFVEIPTSRGTTSALVTAAAAVFLDTIDVPDETADTLGPRPTRSTSTGRTGSLSGDEAALASAIAAFRRWRR